MIPLNSQMHENLQYNTSKYCALLHNILQILKQISVRQIAKPTSRKQGEKKGFRFGVCELETEEGRKEARHVTKLL